MKRKFTAVLAGLAITAATALGLAPLDAHANNGPCGLYGSGFAFNTYCGDYGMTVAATKATWYYSAGGGGIGLRYGNYVTVRNTSYISAVAGDTGAYGCDKYLLGAHGNCG